MPIAYLKRTLRRVKDQADSVLHVLRLTLEGNEIERITDFNQRARPVLLLYGWGMTRRVFHVLERRLRRDGLAVFSLNLGGIFNTYNTRKIEELATHVAQKIERLYQRRKLKDKLVIVGHSKGGLIGQYYIKFLGGERFVDTLITLGTPHQGTPWAQWFGFTPLDFITGSLKQMKPNSVFLKKLKTAPWPKKVKAVSISSKADVLCPYPSGRLEDPRHPHIENIEFDGISHSGLLIKKRVYQAIQRKLKVKPRFIAFHAAEARRPTRRKEEAEPSNKRSIK